MRFKFRYIHYFLEILMLIIILFLLKVNLSIDHDWTSVNTKIKLQEKEIYELKETIDILRQALEKYLPY